MTLIDGERMHRGGLVVKCRGCPRAERLAQAKHNKDRTSSVARQTEDRELGGLAEREKQQVRERDQGQTCSSCPLGLPQTPWEGPVGSPSHCLFAMTCHCQQGQTGSCPSTCQSLEEKHKAYLFVLLFLLL